MALLPFLIAALALLVAAYGTRRYIKNRRFWKLLSKVKGERSLPIIGNVHQLGNGSEVTFRNSFKMLERLNYSTFKFLIGYDVFVMLSEPHHAEALLTNNDELKKIDDYHFMKDWLGKSILLSEGDEYRNLRKLINPAFHYKILEQFVEVFNDITDVFLKKLDQKKGSVFDVYPIVTLFSLDLLSETAMGVKINAMENPESEYIKACYRICEIYNHRSYSPFKRFDFIFSMTSDRKEEKELIKVLHNNTYKAIEGRKQKLKVEEENKLNNSGSEEKNRFVYMDILLKSRDAGGNPLPDDIIRAHVDNMMFGGHHTSASAISFALYSLANNPDAQAKAYEEQMAIFGDDSQRSPTYNELLEMKYLDLVVKETVRLYPSVPLLGRKLMNDLKLDDEITLPKGCFAMINHFGMHRSPRYYDDPNKFEPERFSPENSKGRHPYAFTGFSAGVRNCVGYKFALVSMKAVLSKIIRRFEFYSAGPGTELRLATEITLKSASGVHVQIRDRSRV